MTRVETIEAIEILLNTLKNGCSNHGCPINTEKGMKTNSRCRCNPTQFVKELKYLHDAVLNEYKLGGPWK